MADYDIVAAGFSAILGGSKVAITDEIQEQDANVISIHDVFQMTYVSIPFETREQRGKLFNISVKGLTGSLLTLQVAESSTIGEVMAAVEDQQGIPIKIQRLIYSGKQLREMETMKSARIVPESVLYQILRLTGGGGQELGIKLPKWELAPRYDYDFTNEFDDGKRYMRGKFEYQRPYGWYRIALKVLGDPKYGGDSWLGPDGIRTDSSADEWPVSYHGTNMNSTKLIVKEGYKAGPRQLYGKGVYSSPSLSMVKEHYAQTYESKGNKWKIALQNRVNPNSDHLKIISSSDTNVGADYWVSPKHDPKSGVYDVRPYGVVICKI